MIWTHEKPTQPGWYWWRNTGLSVVGRTQVCKVSIYKGKYRAMFIDGERPLVADLAGEWAGPIEEPEEQS